VKVIKREHPRLVVTDSGNLLVDGHAIDRADLAALRRAALIAMRLAPGDSPCPSCPRSDGLGWHCACSCATCEDARDAADATDSEGDH
jgi:hypothetical protein